MGTWNRIWVQPSASRARRVAPACAAGLSRPRGTSRHLRRIDTLTISLWTVDLLWTLRPRFFCFVDRAQVACSARLRPRTHARARPSTAGACSWPPGRFPSPVMPLSFYLSWRIVRPLPTAHPPSTQFARTGAMLHRAELHRATTRRCCRRPSQIPVELAALLRSLYSYFTPGASRVPAVCTTMLHAVTATAATSHLHAVGRPVHLLTSGLPQIEP
jgi:hypothetical protein